MRLCDTCNERRAFRSFPDCTRCHWRKGIESATLQAAGAAATNPSEQNAGSLLDHLFVVVLDGRPE